MVSGLYYLLPTKYYITFVFSFNGKIRFAPSPTGYLHQGHLLSALYVWSIAEKLNLHIHLRIEDHDKGRARKEYIDSIYQDLEWLGFNYHSQSMQSTRQNLYQDVLKELQSQNQIYTCFCSRKQLEQENPKSPTGEIIYQGKCRNNTLNTLSNPNLPPHSLRIRILDKVIKWNDLRLGPFAENPAKQCGDFTLLDREGCYTYQFASTVDDIEQGITHIVRGEDIRSSTARQIYLAETICSTLHIPYLRPTYLHHGLIVDDSGKKLSKRELAHSIRQDKEAGMTPEQLFGLVLCKAGFLEKPTPLPLSEALKTVTFL
ncbi:MAG: hypothetical protein HUK20_15475 [Fibrobacter sp.]|nr:hypothetical protein [Fibrobacter sp.]